MQWNYVGKMNETELSKGYQDSTCHIIELVFKNYNPSQIMNTFYFSENQPKLFFVFFRTKLFYRYLFLMNLWRHTEGCYDWLMWLQQRSIRNKASRSSDRMRRVAALAAVLHDFFISLH